MTSLLFGFDNEIAEWVRERIDFIGPVDFGPCAAIGVMSDAGELIAGVVYHDYQPHFSTIQLSMAAENPMWAKRENLRALLSYPFNQLEVNKAWIATPLRSERALRTFYKIGFKKEAVLADHFGPKNHCVMARMLAKDFKRLYDG